MAKKKSEGETSTPKKQDAASAFWKAIKDNKPDAIKRLLPLVDPKRDRKNLARALMNAVYWNNAELVDLLLTAGADPDPKVAHNTLLMSASINGKLEIVKRLIKAGTDYNREVKKGTALSAALSYHQVPVIKYLEKLKAYSPPNLTLLYASMHGDVARAKRAIQQGADMNQPGGIFDETPLMAAARKGQLATVKLLLQQGANPNKEAKTQTPLFSAARYGKNLGVINALVKAGADIHTKHYDETVMMAAVQGGCFPIVKRLVELGADVNARDKDHGVSALDHAQFGQSKEITRFLKGLGAKSDRDGSRALMNTLATEFGGTITEHSRGFLLNSRFHGNKCQFSSDPEGCTIGVHGLKFSLEALRKPNPPTIVISPGEPAVLYKGFQRSNAASQLLGLNVYARSQTKDPIDSQTVAAICSELKAHIPNFKLIGKECLVVTSEALKCLWLGTEIEAARPKFTALQSLIRTITRPPMPDRFLFDREWLIKCGPRSDQDNFAQCFGGTLEQPVACPKCGNATNRMLQINFADSALPSTPLGRKRLPVFWCLECCDWEPASYDISGPFPKLIPRNSKKASKKIQPGEENLEQQPALLVPVPAGKKAGRKSKLGGAPTWIQLEQTPDCPKCEKPMAFVLQLASDADIMYGDMGMLYAFVCPECQVATSLVQSH